MTSRWLDIGRVLFLRVYGPRRKKRTRPISSHLDRTSLVNKGFIIWLLGKFFLRDKAGSPERARWLHLARSGSQSQRRIPFILPAPGASHTIRLMLTRLSFLRYFLLFNITFHDSKSQSYLQDSLSQCHHTQQTSLQRSFQSLSSSPHQYRHHDLKKKHVHHNYSSIGFVT